MAKDGDIGSTLRKSGHRATGPRIAILTLLKKERRPMSAQEIIDASKGTIDPSTIYRTLASLKEKGIVRQVDLRHHHAHYEFSDPSYQHHLICTRCGKIEGVKHDDVATFEHAVLRGAKQFAEITTHALTFYGVCKKCAARRS